MENITYTKLSDSFSLGIHEHTPPEVSESLKKFFGNKENCEEALRLGTFRLKIEYPCSNLFCIKLVSHSTQIAYNFDCMMCNKGISGNRHFLSDEIVANH